MTRHFPPDPESGVDEADDTLALAQMIDHTLLRADATANDIDQLCAQARDAQFAAVCVHPAWVARAAAQLADSDVLVCTVVGFPLGANAPQVKAFETRIAIEDGADEIDLVWAVGAFLGGEHDRVRAQVTQVARICADAGVTLKVILETGYLDAEQIVTAARLAVAAGAGFVKTSTGFGPRGASVEDVEVLRTTVGDDIGVKASGGIRTREQALQMRAAGANRLGTSAGPQIVGAVATPPPRGY